MVNRTFHEYPGKKWYVFIEADTYILWSSLLDYLSTLDPSQPLYAGSRVYVGDVAFAHGGSGFIVSHPAMQSMVQHYQAQQEDIERFVDQHWAGDCVLGKIFADIGINLTEIWPHMQGDHPGNVAYVGPDGRSMRAAAEKAYWCKQAVSYHQMRPDMIHDLWQWEQELLQQGGRGSITHGEMFFEYVLPRMGIFGTDWDNESENSDEWSNVSTIKECRAECELTKSCVQFAFDQERHRCRHYRLPRLGKAAQNVHSGWMLERITQLADGMGSCE